MESQEEQRDNSATDTENEDKSEVPRHYVSKVDEQTDNDEKSERPASEKSLSNEQEEEQQQESQEAVVNHAPLQKQTDTPIGATVKHDTRTPENTSHPICDICITGDSVETTATAFCVDCVEYMCTQCAQDHRRIKLTRQHKQLSGEDMPRSPGVFKAMKELTNCPDHPGVVVTYTCEDHESYICGICKVEKHDKCGSKIEVTADHIPTEQVEERLRRLCERVVAIRETKEVNISALLVDHEEVNIKRNDFKERIVDHVQELWESSHVEAEALLDKEKANIENDVQTCQNIESEGAKNQELMKTAMMYGCPQEINVITSKILKDLEKLETETDLQEFKPKVRLECSENSSFLEQKKLCNISARNVDSEPENSLVQMKVHQSSDICDEEASGSTRDFMKRQIGGEITKHNVSSPCKVIGIEVLNDGRIAIIDENNKMLKVFSGDFYSGITRRLEDTPLDMCKASDNILAVIFDHEARVSRYRIEGCIYDDGRFLTSSCPSAISTVNTKRSTIALLLRPFGSLYHFQIRSYLNGQVLRNIELKIDMVTPCRMLVIRDVLLLIAEENKVHSFIIDNKSSLPALGLYASHGNNVPVDDIYDIAFDKDENIYILCKGSHNIHLVSDPLFTQSRVLTLNLENPVSLCFDKTGTNILIGCANDDYLHVFPLV